MDKLIQSIAAKHRCRTEILKNHTVDIVQIDCDNFTVATMVWLELFDYLRENGYRNKVIGTTLFIFESR